MVITVRILAALPALMFLFSGLQWLVDPAAAAEGLGMPLLTGIGASTQIGDIGALFVGGGAIMCWAQLPGRSAWFYPAAVLLGAAALMRTLSWVLGHADLALTFIAVEIVMAGIMILAAQTLGRATTPS
jgi:hypothetical protein